jgi:hypothetical protein
LNAEQVLFPSDATHAPAAIADKGRLLRKKLRWAEHAGADAGLAKVRRKQTGTAGDLNFP